MKDKTISNALKDFAVVVTLIVFGLLAGLAVFGDEDLINDILRGF